MESKKEKNMRTRTKILLGIIALIIIGLIGGKYVKSEDLHIDDQQTSVAIDEHEQNETLTTEVEEESQSEEIIIEDRPVCAETNDHIESDNSSADNASNISNHLEVHYIDVGQGDATLIICNNEAMLVDAGDEGKGTAIQLYLKKHNIERLKYVVATHPDADHIGGLDVIVYKFDCGQILIPNCTNNTYSFEQLQNSMKAKGYSPHVVDVGEKYTLGSAQIEILSPSSEFTFAETNDSSIVFRLDYGNNSFLFTGDATIPPQQALIYDPDLDIDVDVLKVPHHGASTAYIKGFYDEVSPKFAVISCGRDNQYDHPRQEVLDDLKNRGTKVFRTDEQGTIVAISDGKTITFNTDSSASRLSGNSNKLDNPVDDEVISNTRGLQHDEHEAADEEITYVYNKNRNRFHYPDCSSVPKIKPENRVDLNCTREELLNTYPKAKPCKNCNP